MEYKIKRIDKLLIVVGTTILQRTLSSDDERAEEEYQEINSVVEELNSDLTPHEIKKDLRNNLYILMNPKKVAEKLAKEEKEMQTLEETLGLAGKDDDFSERFDDGRRVVGIDDRFEQDDEGYVYLKGFSVPLPRDLIKAILDATYNPHSKYTLSSLINFWQWAVLNPNPEARNDLFGWFSTGSFSITEEGMIVAYRCVNVKQEGIDAELGNFVNTEYLKVKSWKKSPKNYGVITKDGLSLIDLKKYPDVVNDDSFKGSLSDLYSDLNTLEGGTIYTDNHTGRMTIIMGEPVSMPREECDENRDASCSYGLHFMSKKYNLRLGNVKIVVLINPMNIVAFPRYDNTKGRCCEYLPIGNVETDGLGNIIEFDSGSYSFEYAADSLQVLADAINNVGLEQLQEEGQISADVTMKDLVISRDTIKASISKRLRKHA